MSKAIPRCIDNVLTGCMAQPQMSRERFLPDTGRPPAVISLAVTTRLCHSGPFFPRILVGTFMYTNKQNYPSLGGSKRPRTESEPNSPIQSDYDRFFKITLQSGTFQSMSPFLINKCLQSEFGTLKDTKKLSDGSLLIEVANERQSQKAETFNKLHTYDIITVPHKTLNIVKGVVTCADLINCSNEEILENLKDQAVTDIYRIPAKKGTNMPSSTLILSFKLHQLPKTIKAGFYSLRVRQYYPNPMRCYNCQRFGHTAMKCTNSPNCSSCGHSKHPDVPCPTPAKCVNCGENHSPGYKGCSIYKREFEIQKIRTNDNISYFEAKRKLNLITPSTTNTYSSVTAKKTQMVTVATQCDMTQTLSPQTDPTNTSSKPSLPLIIIPKIPSSTQTNPTPNTNPHSPPHTENHNKKPPTKSDIPKPTTPTLSRKPIITKPPAPQKPHTSNKDPPKRKTKSLKSTPNSSSESILDLNTTDLMEIEVIGENFKPKKK